MRIPFSPERPGSLPTYRSLDTYRRQKRAHDRQAAYNEGTFVGFGCGLLAGLIAWLLLSGTLVQMAASLWATYVYLARAL